MFKSMRPAVANDHREGPLSKKKYEWGLGYEFGLLLGLELVLVKWLWLRLLLVIDNNSFTHPFVSGYFRDGRPLLYRTGTE